MTTTTAMGHAVVLGASMGGLLAARVLADAYQRVTIVERDLLPDAAQHRRGVPQGRHAHALLPRGAQIIDELFPGVLDDLEAGGVPVISGTIPNEIHFVVGGHLMRADEPMTRPEPAYEPSRPYLESHVREQLRKLPHVDVLERCDVLDLTTTDARDRVTGVRVVHADGAVEEELDADLVVDAMGRGARTPAWLERLGFGRPAEDRIPVEASYASQLVRLKPGALHEKLVIIGPVPGRPTNSVLFAQEDDSWIFTVAGLAGSRVPTNRDQMIAFAEEFTPARIIAALRDAEPLSEVRTHRFPASQWRRYDKMRRLPDALIAFGDAMCSFNPIYGQGMTVAALEAVALRECLRRGSCNLPRRFFRAAAKPVRVAWQLAAGSDLALPEIAAPCPPPIRIVNAYIDRYLAAAERDIRLTEQFLRVSGLVDPPAKLFRPSIMMRVAVGNRRRRLADSRATPRDLAEPARG